MFRSSAIRRHLFGATLGAALLVTGACASSSSSGRVYLRVGPPASIVERQLDSPGPGYVWQPGYYRWNGRDYVWQPGRYERAPRARARWQPGHWEHARGGWYWVDGRWR